MKREFILGGRDLMTRLLKEGEHPTGLGVATAMLRTIPGGTTDENLHWPLTAESRPG